MTLVNRIHIKSKILWIFIVVAIIHLVAILVSANFLIMISKPLLMPLLLIYFLNAVGFILNKPKNNLVLYFLMALIFSTVGDVFLMIVTLKEQFFLLGLASFLIAHFFYIFGFMKIARNNSIKQFPHILPLSIGFLYFTFMLFILFPYLESSLRFPIILYALTIITMVLTSTRLKDVFEVQNFKILLSGTILFVISDSAIAINKFYHEFPLASFFIMITYIFAQFFIISSIINENKLFH